MRARHVRGDGSATLTPADGLWLSGRPYVPDTVPTEVPPLVVDGPPGARGRRPAGDLPIVRTYLCSRCHDGRQVLARSRSCPWCGQAARLEVS